MSYLEVIKRKGKIYYYATKNFRVGINKWKKVRRFLGAEKPSEKTLKNAFRDIEDEIIRKGYRTYQRFSYLDDIDVEKVEDIKDAFKKWFGKLSPEDIEKYESDFLVRFTYNTNAIEGNRLSLRETAMILMEAVIPAGSSINDYNEALNSRDAYELAKNYRGELNRRFMLKIHKELTKNTKCRVVGAFRDSEVRISGSEWVPPPPREVPLRMKKLLQWYNNHKNRHHPVELGALMHTKLVQIHPFTDGNGRTARLVMNWILLKKGYPMFYIETRDKKSYYDAIEAADKGNHKEFVKYAANNIIEQFTFLSRDRG